MRQDVDAKNYVITAILLLFAIGLMVTRHDGGLQNARKVSVSLLSYLEQPLSYVRVYRQALSSNTYLQRQNVLLQDELSRLRSVEQQNQILRGLLELEESSSHTLIPVRVVAKELTGLNNKLTIDAGSASGIETGMPVINSDGLVGHVTLTTAKYSQVLPYSNSLFRVSARVQESRAYGIVSWKPDTHRELFLDHIPQTIVVEEKQIVETSGFSNQFPSGIPIGEVIRIEPADGVETQDIFLNAFVDLNTLAEAFVIVFEPDSMMIELNSESEELF